MHPLPAAILEHRMLAKLKSTYLDALPRAGQPAHRAHPHRLPPGGGGHRPPVVDRPQPAEHPDPHRDRALDPRRVRRRATATRSSAADYSQIELRVLAHLSGDPELIEAFRAGADVHARTARALFGVDEKRVTREMRGQAKTVNFAVIYGQTQFALARNLRIERGQAARYIKAFFEQYAGVPRTCETRRRGRADGRSAHALRPAAQAARPRRARTASSARRPSASRATRRIQGSAADVITREASEREAEAAAQIAAAQSESKIKQSRARAEAERVDAEAAQAGPLADATARQQVVVQETEIAKLEAARQEQRLNATVYKEADAAAYSKRVQAEATKSADISAAEANARKVELAATADARKVELTANAEATAAEARARATRTTGEAEAAATTARGAAAASATKAMAVAEADGIQARATALSANQDAVIAQQLAERMPEIVRAAAEPFAHVGQLTVLNGAEGLNSMVGSIIAQVGTLLPQLASALGKSQPPSNPASTAATRPLQQATQNGPNASSSRQ